MIIEKLPLLNDILSDWEALIGDDFQGYKNHVQRMVLCCFALSDLANTELSDKDKEKIIIAGAFHDIGIWVENTLDYLPPSLPPAREYLKKRGLEAWTTEIELMITEHHKFKAYKNPDYPLVELFRKGDLVDFSLGAVRFGLDKQEIKQLKAKIPNAGFHKGLLKKVAKWFIKHPLNPAPMMKW
jgi:hypothetical protein